MQSNARKNLKSVDISFYNPEITTIAQRLQHLNLAPNTLRDYLACIKIFFAWCVVYLASKSAMLLDYDDFRAFLQFLEREDHLMARTINCYIAALKQFRYFIQKEDWNRYEIRFKRYDRTLPKVPSVEQAGLLLASCSSLLEAVLVMLLLSTGLRIAEVCALTYGDIRRDIKQIYVRPGKGRSDRYVPLDDFVLDALAAYCKDVNQLRRHAGLPILQKEDPIFYFDDGIRPANKSFLSRTFGKVDTRAMQGKAHFTPHSCRHFFALQIYLQKHDLLLVKELLGHRSLNATEVYLRLAAAMSLEDAGYTNPLHLCKKPDSSKEPDHNNKPNGNSDD